MYLQPKVKDEGFAKVGWLGNCHLGKLTGFVVLFYLRISESLTENRNAKLWTLLLLINYRKHNTQYLFLENRWPPAENCGCLKCIYKFLILPFKKLRLSPLP